MSKAKTLIPDDATRYVDRQAIIHASRKLNFWKEYDTCIEQEDWED